MTEEQIEYMTCRFLGWKLPDNFNPDNGVTFEPIGNKGHPTAEYKRELSGTNLLDYDQAKKMVEYLVFNMDNPNRHGLLPDGTIIKRDGE